MNARLHLHPQQPRPSVTRIWLPQPDTTDPLYMKCLALSDDALYLESWYQGELVSEHLVARPHDASYQVFAQKLRQGAHAALTV